MRLRLSRVAVAVAVLSVGLVTGSSGGQVEAEPRRVRMSKSTGLRHEEMVKVSWSGFRPGPVYLVQCELAAVKWTQCSERTRVEAVTGEDGTGSVDYVVRSGYLAAPYGTHGGNFDLSCQQGQDCGLFVSECAFDVAPAATVKTPLGFTPPYPPFVYDPTPRPAEAPPPVVLPPPPPPPVAPGGPARGPTAKGLSDSSLRLAVEDWQRSVREAPTSRDVETTTVNSPTALRRLVEGADFAVSALPLDADQLAQLRRAGRDAAYAPIAVSALSIGFRNWYSVFRLGHLNLSAATLARIYLGTVNGWYEDALRADNFGCGHTTQIRKTIQPVLRGDQSAATHLFTSWLFAQSGGEYTQGRQTIFPLSTSQPESRNSADDVARVIGVWSPSQSDAPADSQARLGYTDHAYLRKWAVPDAAVRNAAGRYVTPTAASVARTVEAMRIGPDGTASYDFALDDPGAYPLVQVHYLVVPVKGITPETGDVLRDFLAHAISQRGQAQATEAGYFPLSKPLLEAATATLAKIPTTQVAPAGTATPSAPPATTAAADDATPGAASPPPGAPAPGGGGTAPAPVPNATGQAPAGGGFGPSYAFRLPGGGGSSFGSGTPTVLAAGQADGAAGAESAPAEAPTPGAAAAPGGPRGPLLAAADTVPPLLAVFLLGVTLLVAGQAPRLRAGFRRLRASRMGVG